MSDTVATAYHPKGKGAKTKGYIKNASSGIIKNFMFNPESLQYMKSATYSETSSPGLSYPLTQYVRGNSITFSIPLYIYDRSYTGAVKEWEAFLSAFLPPEINGTTYTKPDMLTLVMGSFIKNCVLESLDINYTAFNSDLEPTEATLTLGLRVV